MNADAHTGVALLLGAVAAAATYTGGLLVARGEWSALVLKHFVALGSGFMLAAVFLEMIPESLHVLTHEFRHPGDAGTLEMLSQEAVVKLFALMLGGYLLVHFFEHTLAPHLHFGEETHVEEVAHAHVGFTALLGLGIHAFFDGVAIGSGFAVSGWLGTVIFLAVVLHKLPEGFTVASLMLASGQGKRVAQWSAAVLGVATLAGVLLMNLLRGGVVYALPLSAGVTLYVAASDLIPEVNKEHGIKMALVVFLGVALMAAMHFFFHLEHGH
jgi:ZIP family zinc transporter/zinc and cadmium transporter